MTEKKIPKSVLEIIDQFIKNNFKPLTYKLISKKLNKDVNTITQRIKRHENYFNVQGPRPYKITIKKGLTGIYLLRDRNQCQICRKTYNSTQLSIRFKNPNMKDKYKWENVITCCKNCKKKNIVKGPGIKKKKKTSPKSSPEIDLWEYKEIYIKKKIDENYSIKFPQDQELNEEELEEELESYYEFDELNGLGFFHIINDDKKICSLTVADILNYFGEFGWKLIKIEKIPRKDGMKTYDFEYIDHNYDANYNEYDYEELEYEGNDNYHNIIVYRCFFEKKKVRGGLENGKK